jgi:ribosomal protein S20
MSKAGLWIDYRKAIIVSVMETREEIKKVVPESEKCHRPFINLSFKDRSRTLHKSEEHRIQSIFQEQLNTYYDEVIANICDANSILIFGSNTAKDKLKQRLEMNKLGDIIVSIETSEQMSERQISAKILQQV